MVTLDGSSSTASNGTITSYKWTRISGRNSFKGNNSNSPKSIVDSLKKGVYEFELKVIDNMGLIAMDIVIIIVKDPSEMNNEDSTDVIFYWPEPTATVSFKHK